MTETWTSAGCYYIGFLQGQHVVYLDPDPYTEYVPLIVKHEGSYESCLEYIEDKDCEYREGLLF